MRYWVFIFLFGLANLGCQSPLHNSDIQRSVSGTSSAIHPAVRGTALSQEVFSLEATQQNGLKISLRIGKCKNTETCLFFQPQGEAEKSISISAQTVRATEIGLMGPHFSGKYEAVYLYVYMDSPFPEHPNSKSAVFVIDPNQLKKVAWADNLSITDYSLYNSYFSLAKGPGGKAYPFLGPGMHYLNVPYWDYLCFFDVNRLGKQDSKCGPGFRSVSTSFRDKYWKTEAEVALFRHNRGWLLDVDNDGWDDIHLPFFKYILSLSGRTGKQLTLSIFDMAKASEPNALPFFHHGRYYGGYTIFKDPKNANPMVLLTAGSTVGSFANWNCNVSRYTAALRWHKTFITGKPYATLAWSDYASYSNTSFTWDYKSVDSYFRKGDQINKCIHRFSDSMVETDGSPTMAFSQFETKEKYDCEKEAFESSKNISDPVAAKKMQICMEAGTKITQGTWNIHVKNAVTGANLNSLPRAYLWGRIENFLPGEGPLLVIENFLQNDGKVRFDKANHTPEQLSFIKLARNASWQVVDQIPSPGAVPRVDYLECMTSQSGSQSSSMDASCGRPEFIVQDIDKDGLNDFQLENGNKWIGYSAKQQKVIVKTLRQ